MKKVVAISLVLLGIVFLGWVWSTTSEPTQPITPAPVVQTPTQPVATQPISTTPALATYTNAKWGFEVKYPTGYEVEVDVEKVTELDFAIRKTGDKEEAKNTDGVCANCALILQVLPKFIGGSEDSAFKTPEDWVKFQRDGGLQKQKDRGLNFSQTTLAGKTAYYSAELEPGRKTYLIFVSNGVMYDRYDISAKGNDSNADTILSTFKFTK
jgi:hypothetical protein